VPVRFEVTINVATHIHRSHPMADR